MNGFNSRLDIIEAAMLSVKLKYIDKRSEMRNSVAQKYNELLKDVAVVAKISQDYQHSFNYYTVFFKDKETKDKVQKHLAEKWYGSQVYYPYSLHLQKVYEYRGYKEGDFP